MKNPPTVSDCCVVSEYLSKFGIDLEISSIEEKETQPGDMMCFKYNVTFIGNGKRMRGSMYGTHGQWIRHASNSCWEIVSSIFNQARMAATHSYKNLCHKLELNGDENDKRWYNKHRYQYKRLMELGLSRADIEEIDNYCYNLRYSS